MKKPICICLIITTVITILCITIIPAVVISVRKREDEDFDGGFDAGGFPGGPGGQGGGLGGPGSPGGIISPGPAGGYPNGNPNVGPGNSGNGRAPILPGPTNPQGRAQAVKDAFQFAWTGYYTKAFPNDELHPLDNTVGNSRNGWGATAIDALSTAVVMQLPDVVSNILAFVPQIDYSHTPEPVSVFETNIRYLGGMLSGYDLLTGPFSSLVQDNSTIQPLLTQATKLADLLSAAFMTPSGIPDNILHFNGGAIINGSTQASIATIGTLQLEWARLSRLTNNPKYAQVSQKPMSFLLQPTAGMPGVLAEPFPGLVGQYVRISDGAVIDQQGGWGPESDSFYEYLIKMYVYKPSDFGNYRDRWVQAVESTMTYLASKPSTRPDLTFMAHYDGTKLLPHAWHLDCFSGGNILFGGSVLNVQRYMDFGLDIINGCHETYTSTMTRVGPEAFQWYPTDCTSAGVQPGQKIANFTSTSKAANLVPATVDCSAPPSQDDTKAYSQTNGHWIADGSYGLRPEVMESYYYAYRITGDQKYQDWAWEAFSAITNDCRLTNGFNFLNNVNVDGGQNGVKNTQESYFFAETMMYAFLIFDDDGPWHVNYQGGNQFVFNTEGHPIHVAAA